MTNKYLRTIYGVDKEGNAGSLQVDVYDILDAYPTKNPALDHLIKKALCPGQRGHKDLLTDLDDIIKSAQRAKAMIVNKMAGMTEVTLNIENVPVLTAELEKALQEGGAKVRFEPGAPTPQAGFQLQGNQEQERIDARRVSAAPPASAAVTRPTCFYGKVLCYYPDKLKAEGILKTFHELTQKAGIATKSVGRADAVGADGILVDGPNPSENVIIHFMDKGIFIYGVREANVILRGHVACQGQTAARPTSFKGLDTIYVFPGVLGNRNIDKLEDAADHICHVAPIRDIKEAPIGAVVVGSFKTGDTLIYGRHSFNLHEAISILAADQLHREAVPASEEAEPVERPAVDDRAYDYSFSDRPTSFKESVIYILESVKGEALSELEKILETPSVETVPEYVRSFSDCPDGAIVIWPEGDLPFPVDGRWHFTVGSAIDILINDQKGNDNNA